MTLDSETRPGEGPNRPCDGSTAVPVESTPPYDPPEAYPDAPISKSLNGLITTATSALYVIRRDEQRRRSRATAVTVRNLH